MDGRRSDPVRSVQQGTQAVIVITYDPAVPAPLPAPDFDPGAAFPEVNRLRAALTGADWPAVEQLFDGRDAKTVSHLVNNASDHPGIEGFLRSEVARQPGEALPATLLAACLVVTGWSIRTDKRANQVSREQFDQLHAYLRQAEQILIDVTARHPAYVTAWDWRLTTAMGLQMGQSEARRRYDRLARHEPHHLPGQQSLLQKLCPKWGGSWEAAHTFARECMNAAPEGGHHGVLVVTAHLEQALESDTLRQAGEYLLTMPVWQSIQEAARRSVWHPGFQHDWGWVGVRGTFAMAFGLMGDHKAAAAQFSALGNLGSEAMFGYLGDATEQFQRFRADAYAKGGAR